MRHGAAYRKLGRTASHRTAMFANMAVALVKHEKIKILYSHAVDEVLPGG